MGLVQKPCFSNDTDSGGWKGHQNGKVKFETNKKKKKWKLNQLIIFFSNSKVAHSDTPLTRKRADQSRSSSVSVLLDINILDVIQIYNFNKLYEF